MEKMFISQKLFSLLGKFDVINEQNQILYTVEGQWSWTKKLVVYDANHQEAGMIQGVFWSFLPRFEVWIHGKKAGEILKEFSFLAPKYKIQFLDWQAQGNLTGWNYTITDSRKQTIGTIREKPFRLADYYTIEYEQPAYALPILMLVLAIDAVSEAQAAAATSAAG